MISVLMANFNNNRFLEESIDSVTCQSFEDWELIVVDDCSSDDSVETIKKYADGRKIRYFKNDENIGYTATLKKLVEKARGEIVCILDSDDAIDEGALKKIATAYQENKSCAYIYTQCYYCDENLKPVHLGFSKKIKKGKTNLHDSSVVAMRTFKKDAYYKTSGYDEEIKFAEDIDLTLKMEEVTNLFFIDKPLYYYRILPKSQTHSFVNTQINRSSTALAKLNAYKRRLGTNIPNLNKNEISEVLFFGVLTSFLARRLKLALRFIREVFKINLWFFLKISFYMLLLRKVVKIVKLKKEKPLLKIT